MNTIIMHGGLISCLFLLLYFERTAANTTINFTIETLWNSTPIVDYRPVQLALSSTTDKNNLLIEIDATFFN
jgi:hypothetical protein